MVYDEGFEVKIDDQVFFAFSKFDAAPKGAETNFTENAKRSHCGETMRGWYRDASRTKWGCYKAQKVQTLRGNNAEHGARMMLLSVMEEEKSFNPSKVYDDP